MKRKSELTKIQDYIPVEVIPSVIEYLEARSTFILNLAEDFIYEGGDQKAEFLKRYQQKGAAFYQVAQNIKEIWNDSGWDKK